MTGGLQRSSATALARGAAVGALVLALAGLGPVSHAQEADPPASDEEAIVFLDESEEPAPTCAERDVDGDKSGPPAPTWASPLWPRILADASQRTGLPEDAFRLVLLEEVTWTDSSLGCPQPGRAYLQVLTPGHDVLLRAGDLFLSYHTDAGRRFVLCQRTAPILPPRRDGPPLWRLPLPIVPFEPS